MPAPGPAVLDALRSALRAALRPSPVARVRWVLLCFVLSLGVAVAAPMVHPQRIELVCAPAGALKTVVHTDDGVQALGADALHCPLCLLSVPPPTAPALRWPALPQPLHTPWPSTAARIAVLAGAPLPARGPPTPR